MRDKLSDRIGETTITTQMAPEEDRWISRAVGGVMDGHMWSMDLSGDQSRLHAIAIEDIKATDNA